MDNETDNLERLLYIHSPADQANQRPIEHAKNILVLNNFMDKNKRVQFDESVEFFDSWSKVLNRVEDLHGDSASVAVFPTAAFQFNPEKYPLII